MADSKEKKRDSIQTDSPEWIALIERVINEFEIGQLIPHEWLRQMFQIKPLDMKGYPDTRTFIMAVQDQQFEFLGLFEHLRKDILKNHEFLLVNIRGQGYRILHPKDQTSYAYDSMIRDIKKAFKEAGDIMTHVRTNLVDQDQRAKDRQLFSKMGSLKQLFSSFR